MDTKLEEIKALIKDSKRIVFLGGAGVSTASGIPDFRSPAGLYKIHSEYGVSYETTQGYTKEFDLGGKKVTLSVCRI